MSDRLRPYNTDDEPVLVRHVDGVDALLALFGVIIAAFMLAVGLAQLIFWAAYWLVTEVLPSVRTSAVDRKSPRHRR